MARRQLAPGLAAVVPDLKAGNVESALKALDDFWSQLGVSERSGDFGSVTKIEADWFYALGPREKSRFQDLLRRMKRLRSALVSNRGKGPPPPEAVNAFIELQGDATWLEKVMRGDEEDSFPHGDFTIIPMRGVSHKALDECLAGLDEAAQHLRSKGFAEVLYGKVFIKKPKNPLGLYMVDNDTFHLSIQARADGMTLHAIIHELGHRFDYRFWKDQDQRDEFRRLSTTKDYEYITMDKPTRAKLADEWMANAKLMREGRKSGAQSELLTLWVDERMREELQKMRGLARRYVYDKDDSAEKPLWNLIAMPEASDSTLVNTKKIVREPCYVSEYGKEKTLAGHWNENFAEAFAHYVLGKPLPAELGAIMAHLKK